MTSKIQYEAIATGSSGNAVIIQRDVLVDCGVPYKSIRDAAKELRLVLLTHRHGDHFNPATIGRLAAERPTLRWACGEWLAYPLLEVGVDPAQIDVLRCRCCYDYSFAKIMPELLNHNVPNYGYHIIFPSAKAFYATDTNDLNGISAPNYDLYLIECNYDDEEIRRRIAEKKMNGEYAYERDVLQNHLSKAKCDDFIYRNIGPGGEYVYLHGHVDGRKKED